MVRYFTTSKDDEKLMLLLKIKTLTMLIVDRSAKAQ